MSPDFSLTAESESVATAAAPAGRRMVRPLEDLVVAERVAEARVEQLLQVVHARARHVERDLKDSERQ